MKAVPISQVCYDLSSDSDEDSEGVDAVAARSSDQRLSPSGLNSNARSGSDKIADKNLLPILPRPAGSSNKEAAQSPSSGRVHPLSVSNQDTLLSFDSNSPNKNKISPGKVS